MGALDHYRHAPAFDRIASEKARIPRLEMGMAAGVRESIIIARECGDWEW